VGPPSPGLLTSRHPRAEQAPAGEGSEGSGGRVVYSTSKSYSVREQKVGGWSVQLLPSLQVTVPLPNIAVAANVTIRDGLEASLQGDDMEQEQPLTPRQNSIDEVDKKKKKRPWRPIKKKIRRRYKKRSNSTTESPSFVFYPTPHPAKQKGYTYILNHTELVPLQPEAPEPVFWNNKALKWNNFGERGKSTHDEQQYSKLQNEDARVRFLSPKGGRHKSGQSNRRSSVFESNARPVHRKEWRYDAAKQDLSTTEKQHKKERRMPGLEKGRRYLLNKEGHPILRGDIRKALKEKLLAIRRKRGQVGQHRLSTFGTKQRNLGLVKENRNLFRTLDSFQKVNRRDDVNKRYIPKATHPELIPYVEYGFVPSPASKSTLRSHNSKASKEKERSYRYKSLQPSITKTNHILRLRGKGEGKNWPKNKYKSSMNDMKILDYYRNEYSSSDQNSKPSPIYLPKESVNMDLKQIKTSNVKQKEYPLTLKRSKYEENTITPIDLYDDVIFKNSNDRGRSKGYKTHSMGKARSDQLQRNPVVHSNSEHVGEEDVYIVYPDSSPGRQHTQGIDGI
jgi:hypothetical protein